MNYARIKKFDIANGPGVRASLYVSGCNHGCKGCFNEEAWDFNYGNKWTKEVEDDLIKHLQKPEIKGLNVLGGEPLQQGRALLMFLRRVKKEVNKPIWLWTGYTFERLIKKPDGDPNKLILNTIDVLIDGKFEEDKKDITLKYRGSSNQRVIDINESNRASALSCGYSILMSEYLVELEGC